MEDIERKYGKLFTILLKSIFDGEILNWDDLLSKLK